MSVQKQFLLLLLGGSLVFTTSCSEETMLAEQCETETSCESNPERKTDWVSTGGIGAGALALGALAGSAGGGGDSGDSSSSDTSSSPSTTGTTGDTSTTETDTSTTDTSTTTPSDTSTTETDTSVTLKATTEFCEDVCDGLVAYYPFFGNANDTSGNGYDGDIFGAEFTVDRNGNSDRSLQFSGLDYALINDLNLDSLGGRSFTIGFNAVYDSSSVPNPNRNEPSSQIFQGLGFGIKLAVNPNNIIEVTMYEEASDFNVVYNFSSEENDEYFSFYGVVDFENKVAGIFMNGSLIRVTPIAGQESDYSMSYSLIGMGSDYTGFVGKIDDLRIYNRALSESEIQQIVGQ